MSRRQPRRVRRADEREADAARRMRREPTAAEAALWRALRDRRLDWVKFRRQHPLGRFVLDFCCPALKLAIELDGPVHGSQVDRDEERSAFLASAGYPVLRFRNDEVLNDLVSVVERIYQEVRALRSLRREKPPSQTWERGRRGAQRRGGG